MKDLGGIKQGAGDQPRVLWFEQKLQDYQNRITDILESFTDAFFEVDQNWVVTYWNREAERLLLVSREQIIGQNLWEVYAEVIPLKFYVEYHRAVKENVAVKFEEYFAQRNLWLEVAAFPSGRGLSVYFKDITAYKTRFPNCRVKNKNILIFLILAPFPNGFMIVKLLSF